MKVNVGCGGWPLPGFVNLDNREGTAANIMADAGQSNPSVFLPFLDSSLDEIYAGHLLEHLEPIQGDWFLKECLRVLKSGGLLGVVVPDMKAVFSRYINGPTMSVEFIPTAV